MLSFFRRNRKSKPAEISEKAEWYVLYEGKAIGELINQRPGFDIFWIDYDLIFYKGNEEIGLDKENWLQCRFQYQHKFSGRVSEYGVCGGEAFSEKDGQYIISMRGL